MTHPYLSPVTSAEEAVDFVFLGTMSRVYFDEITGVV